jgi:peptidoglycan/LPS O-acetylase OafA/YrhL
MSMPIYLFHILFAVAIRFILKKMGIQSSLIFVTIESLVGIIMPIILVRIVEKRVPYLYKWDFSKGKTKIIV